MKAFDTDTLIFASRGDSRGQPALEALSGGDAAVGSVLLLTEALVPGYPPEQLKWLSGALARMHLVPVTADIARASAELRGMYRLKTPDSIHLATAIVVGADEFVTGNRRDFAAVREIAVTFV